MHELFVLNNLTPQFVLAGTTADPLAREIHDFSASESAERDTFDPLAFLDMLRLQRFLVFADTREPDLVVLGTMRSAVFLHRNLWESQGASF